MSDGIKQRIDQNIRDANQFWNTAIEAAALAIEDQILHHIADRSDHAYNHGVRNAAEAVRKLKR